MSSHQAIESGIQICDECEMSVLCIKRTENNHKYCTTCYSRVFKKRECPSCGQLARLNKYEYDAICSSCIRAKPCARCGKTNYKTGKLTSYGMVCKACSPHFRDKKPCELCGTASNRLSKVSRLGHNLRLCPKCQRVDHAICHACNRYRLLFRSDDGRKLCKKCLEQGTIHCKKCNQLMPAGYGQSCEACYWQGLLKQRIKINCAAFKSLNMANHFLQFSTWLGNKLGTHKAAISLNRYLSFFQEIEREFKEIPSYEALLIHFGAASLRKVFLPMQWMEASDLIVVDVIEREANIETRRIEALLNRLNDYANLKKFADGYHNLLKEDLEHKETTLRSIRLALSPSIYLLLKCTEIDVDAPNQKVLNSYLSKSPGQRAALSGFICYLRDFHGVEIQSPKIDVNKAKRNRQKKLESEMLELMKQGCASTDNREWLSVALAYFYGLPRRVGKSIASENLIDKANGGVTVSWNGFRYWLEVS